MFESSRGIQEHGKGEGYNTGREIVGGEVWKLSRFLAVQIFERNRVVQISSCPESLNFSAVQIFLSRFERTPKKIARSSELP